MTEDCVIYGCSKQAIYGFPNREPSVCSVHRTEKTIMSPISRCIGPYCSNIATYSISLDIKAVHCEIHRGNGETDMKLKKCLKCPNYYRHDINKTCESCTEPKPISISQRKEMQIKEYLDSNGIKYALHNRAIKSVAKYSTMLRADFTFVYDGYYVFLEVDEMQHSNKERGKERLRMATFYRYVDMPCIFIRYNPDRYTIGGVPYSTPFEERVELLKSVLTDMMTIVPDQLPGVCVAKYLYYNDFDKVKMPWNVITSWPEKDVTSEESESESETESTPP